MNVLQWWLDDSEIVTLITRLVTSSNAVSGVIIFSLCCCNFGHFKPPLPANHQFHTKTQTAKDPPKRQKRTLLQRPNRFVDVIGIPLNPRSRREEKKAKNSPSSPSHWSASKARKNKCLIYSDIWSPLKYWSVTIATIQDNFFCRQQR